MKVSFLEKVRCRLFKVHSTLQTCQSCPSFNDIKVGDHNRIYSARNFYVVLQLFAEPDIVFYKAGDLSVSVVVGSSSGVGSGEIPDDEGLHS